MIDSATVEQILNDNGFFDKATSKSLFVYRSKLEYLHGKIHVFGTFIILNDKIIGQVTALDVEEFLNIREPHEFALNYKDATEEDVKNLINDSIEILKKEISTQKIMQMEDDFRGNN